MFKEAVPPTPVPRAIVQPDQSLVGRLALRINDAARAAGVSRSLIYEQIANGALPSFKIANRRLILQEDLAAFLAAAKSAGA